MRWVLPLALALAVVGAISMTVGFRPVPATAYWRALVAYDPFDANHVTLMAVRLPRLIAGLIAGAALGVAGTVMQAVTRNPLADPGLLGVNAGAAFALLLGTLMAGSIGGPGAAALAFPGAALASALVFVLGGGLRGDVGPIRLTLAGAALNALLLSLVTAVVLVRQESFDVMRFWLAGSLSMAALRPLGAMALAAGAGAMIAWIAAPRIEALSLGDALARGLGTRPGAVQAVALLAVTLTTGAAVTVAGPIAFLGLMVPPLARHLGGHDLRLGLCLSALLGALILVLSDLLGRLILAPAEVRAGVMTALIGGPVFVLIARSLRPGAQT